MIRMNVKLARAAASIALLVFAALVGPSCNYFKRGPKDVGLPSAPTGTDLDVAARFAVEGDDVPDYFLKAMPDSGVVPVRVTVRNAGSTPLVIHCGNGMDLGEGFEGFALLMNGVPRIPLSPKEAARWFLGPGKANGFKMRGSSAFVAGTFVPAVELYFVYAEADVGRRYRPLFGKSFYPGFESGMMKPVLLEPGGERGGYLYFEMPPGARPDSLELLVRACVPRTVQRSLPGTSFMFTRGDGEMSLFMIGEQPGAASRGLYVAGAGALEPASEGAWTFVAPVSAKTAVIADASSTGSIAACAVNFQSKSKVFIVRRGEKPELLEEKLFTRKIDRVHVGAGGVFVMAEEAFCHRYNMATGAWSPGVKLGNDIDDTGIIGDSIFAFSKARGISFWDASGGVPVAHRRDKALRPAKRSAVGLLDGALVILTRGKSVRPDTLALIDTGAMGEIGRSALPGKVLAASTNGSNLVLQLQDGTLVRIVRGRGGLFSLEEGGALPFEARSLAAHAGGFVAVGDGGAFAAGSVRSFVPGARGLLDVTVPVR